MPPVDDVNDFDRKMRNALKRVSKARDEDQISDKDATDIRKYGLGVSGLANSTLKDRIGQVRTLAEHSRQPILELSEHDYNELLFELETERGWSSGTRRNYEKSLRSFLRYHGYEDTAEEIELTKEESPKFRLDEIILLDEINDLIDAAESSRDKAMLAILWEGAMRITALLSIRIEDYEPKGDQHAVVTVPSAAGTKGATGDKKPLTWGRGHVDNWLAEHPRQDDSAAPLICKHRNDRDQAGEPLTPQYVRKHITELVSQVDGLDQNKITPHSFRHGRATWMARNDYTEREIEQTLDWSRDSAQHDRYEHLLQQDMVNSILRRSGVDLPEEQQRDEESIECPRCGSRNLSSAQYCSNCSLRLSDERPAWLKVYQRAVGEDKTEYLEELTKNPVWNIAELRPALYDEVSSVLITVLSEASIPNDLEPPEDWEWQYPDFDMSASDAERLAREIFGGLPWNRNSEAFAEHYENYPAAAARKEEHDLFYQKGMDLEEYLTSGPHQREGIPLADSEDSDE
jgi:integrase